MDQVLYYRGDDTVASQLTPAQLTAARHDPAGVLWVDLDGRDAARSKSLLSDVFGFHPLTVEDCFDSEQRPKLEDFGAYVFAVTRLPRFPEAPGPAERATEVDLFIGPNYLVTYHDGPVHGLERLRRDAARDSRILARGADDVAARCLQALADDTLEVLDEMDREIDDLEAAVFADTGSAAVERLFRLRHELSLLRRVLVPQREVYNRFAWDNLPTVRPETRLYFREAFDRLVQVLDMVDNRRDLTAVALETHLSVASNRLNETMRLLTAMQMVFLPLTLIASVYGMNFADLPPFRHPGGWALVIGAMLVLAVAEYAVFRRRGWL